MCLGIFAAPNKKVNKNESQHRAYSVSNESGRQLEGILAGLVGSVRKYF